MNRRLIKAMSVCMVLGLCAMAAIADDVDAEIAQVDSDVAVVQTVTARTDCAAVKAELAELQMIMEPDEAQAARKKTLQNTYRRDCAARATGRRANNRGAAAVVPVAAVADVVSDAPAADAGTASGDVLADFAAQKKQMCDKLGAEIDAMKLADDADADKLAQMQAQFDADCVVADAGSDAPDVTDVPAGPSEEDVIAFLDAGLCADGSEPSKFGCCAGERFTDLGNAVFACCPADKSLDCYPPLTPIK